MLFASSIWVSLNYRPARGCLDLYGHAQSFEHMNVSCIHILWIDAVEHRTGPTCM